MVEKVLVLASAPVKRIEQGMKTLVEQRLVREPEITVFCRRDKAALQKLEKNSAVKRLWVRDESWNPTRDLLKIKRENFSVAVVFFTGERGFWKMKLAPFLCRIRTIIVFTGDGDHFYFGLKHHLRFLYRRFRYGLPQDFHAFQDEPERPEGKRILVLQSAPPQVVEKSLDVITEKLFYNPEITLFGREEELALSPLKERTDVKSILTHRRTSKAFDHLKAIRRARFDTTVLFFTGDRGYWKIKVFAFLSGAERMLVFNENLDGFYLSIPNLLRFLLHRLKHGVPHPAPVRTKEKVLVIQSAEPEIIDRALSILAERRLFYEPDITAFIRDKEKSINYFTNNKTIGRTIIHSETRSALKHLWHIRKERYDAAVLFFTGDPSYWKVKYFAFLCGAKKVLVFNENLDGFFFTWRGLIRFLDLRFKRRLNVSRPAESLSAPVLIKLLRIALFPLRFAYLLIYFAVLRIRKHFSV